MRRRKKEGKIGDNNKRKLYINIIKFNSALFSLNPLSIPFPRPFEWLPFVLFPLFFILVISKFYYLYMSNANLMQPLSSFRGLPPILAMCEDFRFLVLFMYGPLPLHVCR